MKYAKRYPIPGYPNYFCDKEGNVWSTVKKVYFRKSNGDFAIEGEGRPIVTGTRAKIKDGDYALLQAKASPSNGYCIYCLLIDGKKKYRTGHRLVAHTFLGNIRGSVVHHKNGVKTDNRLKNLEVISYSGNTAEYWQRKLKAREELVWLEEVDDEIRLSDKVLV